ncbi:hypothetical protein ACOSQ4_025258 [Xanthoceras sorbifolium]
MSPQNGSHTCWNITDKNRRRGGYQRRRCVDLGRESTTSRTLVPVRSARNDAGQLPVESAHIQKRSTLILHSSPPTCSKTLKKASMFPLVKLSLSRARKRLLSFWFSRLNIVTSDIDSSKLIN